MNRYLSLDGDEREQSKSGIKITPAWALVGVAMNKLILLRVTTLVGRAGPHLDLGGGACEQDNCARRSCPQ